ncbi:hypothetical protein [Miltoncostaea oceani]|uniref:hypothetical protein n=1 Tax=Miltoncostaea oceani TaxID=2843216 RepID=UPI001C3E15AE|nr:hypothetical protein [Miltoncostaea oceani]
MNGPGDDAGALRAQVRASLEADRLEPTVRALLELRFPAEGAGASLDEVGAALSMSPAMAAHIEFAALSAIAATERPQPSAAAAIASGPARWAGRPPAERKRP